MSLFDRAIEQLLSEQAARVGNVGSYISRAKTIVNKKPEESHQDLLDDLLCEAACSLTNREYARLLIAIGVARPVDVYINLVAALFRDSNNGFLTAEELNKEIDVLTLDAIAILSERDKKELYFALSSLHKEPH